MKLLIALVLGAIVELYVIYLVATWIGFWSMLALLILVSIAGLFVIRMAGLRTLRRFGAGEAPNKELADGVVSLTGGILLAIPGFVSGLFGLILLLPPARGLVRNQLAKRTSAMATRYSSRGGFRTTTVIATYDRDGVQDVTSTEVQGELPPTDRDP